MEKSKRTSKTTKEQFKCLLKFLEDNQIILAKKTPKHVTGPLWKEFSSDVNGRLIGPSKSVKQWKKILMDWKSNTKRKSKKPNETLNETEIGLLALLAKFESDGKGNEEDPLGIPQEVNYDEQGTHEINPVQDEFPIQINGRQTQKIEPSSLIESKQAVQQIIDHNYTEDESQNEYIQLLVEDSSEPPNEGTANIENAEGALLQAAQSIAKSLQVLCEQTKKRNSIAEKHNKIMYYKVFRTLDGYDTF